MFGLVTESNLGRAPYQFADLVNLIQIKLVTLVLTLKFKLFILVSRLKNNFPSKSDLKSEFMRISTIESKYIASKKTTIIGNSQQNSNLNRYIPNSPIKP